MNAIDIVKTIQRKGVRLSLVGDRIKAERPGGLDDEVRDLIRSNKSQIIPFLRRRPGYSKPYIDVNGDLVIPFDCEPRFKWWTGGQPVYETLLELGASDETIRRYIGLVINPDDYRRWEGTA